MTDPTTGFPVDAQGRVVLEAPERTYADLRTADGHVYSQDANRLVRVWPMHVPELFGAGYALYDAAAAAQAAAQVAVQPAPKVAAKGTA